MAFEDVAALAGGSLLASSGYFSFQSSSALAAPSGFPSFPESCKESKKAHVRIGYSPEPTACMSAGRPLIHQPLNYMLERAAQ